MTDTYTPILTDEQILAIGTFGQSPLKRLEHGRAIERAAIEAYQRQQWRPIETAPKDGEIIVLALIDETTVMVREGRWDAQAGKWTWPWICDLAPNLWMPLPPPPEQQ